MTVPTTLRTAKEEAHDARCRSLSPAAANDSHQFFIENPNVGDRSHSEDWRIRGYNPLTAPDLLQHEIGQTETSKKTVLTSREEASAVVNGTDPNDRLLVVIGPCSIHDPQAALDVKANE
ncbi:Phospho-2-dehydro-3-deoxyheptonate aldolase amt16 [Ascosphaera pollenicola]|nr:Phospho-2-dehydro-3-deoxyheptonate aldolase amt16 [Ascosphaera pollenicola]